MEIGNGIAIAGIWIFVGMLGLSKTVTGLGLWIGTIIAIIMTMLLNK